MKYDLSNTYEVGLKCAVFLDGVEVDDVVSCHTGEGWVKRIRKRASGALMHFRGSVMTLNSFGNVTVELSPL